MKMRMASEAPTRITIDQTKPLEMSVKGRFFTFMPKMPATDSRQEERRDDRQQIETAVGVLGDLERDFLLQHMRALAHGNDIAIEVFEPLR